MRKSSLAAAACSVFMLAGCNDEPRYVSYTPEGSFILVKSDDSSLKSKRTRPANHHNYKDVIATDFTTATECVQFALADSGSGATRTWACHTTIQISCVRDTTLQDVHCDAARRPAAVAFRFKEQWVCQFAVNSDEPYVIAMGSCSDPRWGTTKTEPQ